MLALVTCLEPRARSEAKQQHDRARSCCACLKRVFIIEVFLFVPLMSKF